MSKIDVFSKRKVATSKLWCVGSKHPQHGFLSFWLTQSPLNHRFSTFRQITHFSLGTGTFLSFQRKKCLRFLGVPDIYGSNHQNEALISRVFCKNTKAEFDVFDEKTRFFNPHRANDFLKFHLRNGSFLGNLSQNVGQKAQIGF